MMILQMSLGQIIIFIISVLSVVLKIDFVFESDDHFFYELPWSFACCSVCCSTELNACSHW